MAARSKQTKSVQPAEAVETEISAIELTDEETAVSAEDFDMAELAEEELALLADINADDEAAMDWDEVSVDPADEERMAALADIRADANLAETEMDWTEAGVDDLEEDYLENLTGEIEATAEPAAEATEDMLEADSAVAVDDILKAEPEAEQLEPTVELAPTLNIQHVRELHEVLKKVLEANTFIEINAANVSAIDTCTLQLLAALKQCADNQGKPFLLTDPSERFVESATLLGLADVFELPG